MRRCLGLVALLVLVAGCPPKAVVPPLSPLPIGQAVSVVNTNTQRISGGLKATGAVCGWVVDEDGRKHRFDLNGKLLVIPPRHLRFDVQNALGRTEFLLGSNADRFWLHLERDADTFRFGRHATPDAQRAVSLPLRPDWLIEALGLSGLPTDTTGMGGPVQVVESESQRLLFISYDEAGQGMVRREYWLSRYAPRLVERVAFRDKIGVELMRSSLSDYKPVGADGLLLPHLILVDWPAADARLEFNVRRWQDRGELTIEHPAFVLEDSESLRGQYDRVIDVDTGEVWP